MRAPKGGVRREAKEDQIPTSLPMTLSPDNSVLGGITGSGVWPALQAVATPSP